MDFTSFFFLNLNWQKILFILILIKYKYTKNMKFFFNNFNFNGSNKKNWLYDNKINMIWVIKYLFIMYLYSLKNNIILFICQLLHYVIPNHWHVLRSSRRLRNCGCHFVHVSFNHLTHWTRINTYFIFNNYIKYIAT